MRASPIIIFTILVWIDGLAYGYITSVFRGFVPSIPRVMDKLNVTVLGAGSFGTAIARRIAVNIQNNEETQQLFHKNVRMWLLDEICNNRSLVDIINEDHTNPKYLPNVDLPETIIAYKSIEESVKDADVIIIGIPHQYIGSIIPQIRGKVKPSAIAISLSKGLLLEKSGPRLISDMILSEFGCASSGVLMGANLANEVANDDFVETVVASRDPSILPLMKSLFDADTFNVQLSEDVLSVELCGALKNIVAMAVGFADGLGLGTSSKAAVIRQGIQEMSDFCSLCSRSDRIFDLNVILLSCGVADVIASSYGGRNYRCSAEYVRRVLLENLADQVEAARIERANNLWEEIEDVLLQGQKLQGPGTVKETMDCISYYEEKYGRDNIPRFPLFRRVYRIAQGIDHPNALTKWRDSSSQ